MFLLDRMLVGGVRFVLDKVAVAADQELNDDTHLRETLLAAQMRVELGELSQEEFAALEDEVLARIREIRERRGEGQGPIAFAGGGDTDDDGGAASLEASDIAGIEASFVADDFHDAPDSPEVPAPSAAVIDDAPAAAVGPASEAKRRPARPRRPAKRAAAGSTRTKRGKPKRRR